jgi:uncharacterized protein YjbI with pentapeptide repeats
MANPEHIKILKQGVDAWNKWREQNPDVRPELRFANFSGTNLSGANLSGAYLSDATLSSADFSDADLSSADLIRADLRDADLRDANLAGADLRTASLIRAGISNANLSGADLSSADIDDANLSGTILIGANLSNTKLFGANLSSADLQNAIFAGTWLRGTTFANNDLASVKDLDTVNHGGPSFISIDTIYKSKANIPDVFLRGCGVPDTLIAYARSLVSKAIDYYSCFISYSSKNHNFAERLYADLQATGIRCWFAPQDIKIGDPFRQRIDEAIRIHDKLLLILSKESIASAWVVEEIERALERERRESRPVLFPVRIDDAVINSKRAWAASLRRMRHIGDFSKWQDATVYKKALSRLIRDLTLGDPFESDE